MIYHPRAAARTWMAARRAESGSKIPTKSTSGQARSARVTEVQCGCLVPYWPIRTFVACIIIILSLSLSPLSDEQLRRCEAAKRSSERRGGGRSPLLRVIRALLPSWRATGASLPP
jgi:hypothetical protein